MTFARLSAGGRSRTLPVLLAVAVAGSLALSSCGSDDDTGATSTSGDAAQVAKGATLTATSPLTGLALKGAAASRPVLAVKIDNSANSAPQVGLGGADMIAEELVEGGITRLAVFFQGTTPKEVGPVRSMRATDIGVVQPLHATLVASGGAAPTVKRVRDAGIKTFVEGATGFHRATDRSAPYNLFIDLAALARTLHPTEPAAPYLPFGDAALPKGRPASRLTATFSGSSSSTFEFRGGHYVNTDSNAGPADQFTPTTVLVLRVQVGDAGYLDPAGNHVPETKFVGTGPAMIFSGGRLVRATWSKDGLDSQVELGTAQGALTLPRGKVWIELVPVNGGRVTVGR